MIGTETRRGRAVGAARPAPHEAALRAPEAQPQQRPAKSRPTLREPRPELRWMGRSAIAVLTLLQALCAVYFVLGIALPLLGVTYTPLDWRLQEALEVGAALGLMLGVVLGGMALHRMRRRADWAEEQLRLASETFMTILEQRFAEWRLTPAERDVALFALKGFSTQEIAAIRSTTEGTVKVQTNAIYRKAGVSGRAQLLSVFIDELISVRPEEGQSTA